MDSQLRRMPLRALLRAIMQKSLCMTALGAIISLSPLGSAGEPPRIVARPSPRPRLVVRRPSVEGPMLGRFLEGPMRGVEDIVFAVRVSGRDHWYVNFGSYSDHSELVRQRAFKKEDGVYWGYADGGRLCRMSLRTGKVQVLLDDPRGGVRDPQVHYDGDRILFAYRPGGTHQYHLWEIRADGSGLRQLTDGPDDDFEPTYLPDGDIAFVSSRCHRFVNCFYSRVATLYRCGPDGEDIRMLSSSIEHDNTPWVLPDGRLLYMRWEYVDRSQVHYHHLWTTNPDGSGQMVYFGNLHPGTAMLDAKPIPGTEKIVASFSPGHGRPEHMGHVTVVDPRAGPDEAARARRVSQRRPVYRDPYAFSEDCFLVADPEGISVMDGRGRTELIYRLPPARRELPLACHEPRPLRPRPREPVIPSRVDRARDTGRLVLADVRAGRKMDGVESGEIKKLLVLEQLPKPVNFSGGMQPLTVHGSFTLARVLGTVDVEPDGSAYMELPALRSLFFVALDERDRSVKRMQSFFTLEPGETTSCVGCHEQRTSAPASSAPRPLALRRPPSRLRPIPDVPDVLDFPRDIQPILDRHCVSCHNPDDYAGRVDLCGDHTPLYSVSYWTILRQRLIVDGRNRPRSNLPPRAIGSGASRLLDYLDGSHHDVRPTERERATVRLWIETSATYPGTYAALGCGMYPVQGLPALRRGCGKCHSDRVEGRRGEPTTRFRFGATIEGPFFDYTSPQSLCNLDRPEKSILLRAPLAREAGGLALCERVVFTGTEDPIYRATLERIREAGQRLRRGKRFDMEGFRPNEHYLREMRRFGILTEDATPGAALDPFELDPYELDARYWRSFWHLAERRDD